MLVSLPELTREIAEHNAAERASELSALMGWQWRLARQSELDAAGFYRPATIASVPFPWRLEQSHAMQIAATYPEDFLELWQEGRRVSSFKVDRRQTVAA